MIIIFLKSYILVIVIRFRYESYWEGKKCVNEPRLKIEILNVYKNVKFKKIL